MTLRLQDLGWDAARDRELAELGELAALASPASPAALASLAEPAEQQGRAAPPGVPARVARIDRGICTALTPEPVRVTTAGQPIATGDWVVIGEGAAPGDLPAVLAILTRRSAFVRHRSGEETAPQVVAANADVVLLVASLDTPLSRSRLERYVTLGWQSGSVPVMVLTKADERSDAELGEVERAVRQLSAEVAVRAISAQTGEGVDELVAEFLGPGRTAALVGPSGVGKSTLINRIAGTEEMSTGPTRRDGKGRHTTTHRQLIVLDGKGMLIDTPGMRALGLWEAEGGLTQTFADIEQLAGGCRFADCRHDAEPGCAVTAAVAAGDVDARRVARWKKLRDELGALAERQEAAARRPGARRRA